MRQSENKERQLVLRDLEGQLRKVPFQDREMFLPSIQKRRLLS